MNKNIHLIAIFCLLFTVCISVNAQSIENENNVSWSQLKEGNDLSDDVILQSFVTLKKPEDIEKTLYIDEPITITTPINIEVNLNIIGAGYLRSWIEFAGQNAQLDFTRSGKSTIQDVYLNNQQHSSNVPLVKVNSGTVEIIRSHLRNKKGTCIEKTSAGILNIKQAQFNSCQLGIKAKINNEHSLLIEDSGFQFNSKINASAAIDAEFEDIPMQTSMPANDSDFDLAVKNNHFYGFVDQAYINTGNSGSLLVKGNFFESQQRVVAIQTNSDVVKVQNNLLLFNEFPTLEQNIIIGAAKVSEITANTLNCPSCSGLSDVNLSTSNDNNGNAGKFGDQIISGIKLIPDPTLELIPHSDKVYKGKPLSFDLIVNGYDSCSINGGAYFSVTDGLQTKSYTSWSLGSATMVVSCYQSSQNFSGSASFNYQVWGDPTLYLQWQAKVNGSWVDATHAHYGSEIRLIWSSTYATSCANQYDYSRQLQGTIYANMTYYRYSEWTCQGLAGSTPVTEISTLTPKYEVKIRWCEAGKTGDSRWQCGTFDGSSYNLTTNAQTFVEFHWEAPGATSCYNNFGTYANTGKKGPFKMNVSATSTMVCTWPDNTVLGDQANEVNPAKITIQ